MKLESIEDLAARDLKARGLFIGSYGLTLLASNDIAEILGYHTFTRASYGIGIPYPSGRIGNIRMGAGHTGSKYNSVPHVTRNEVYWLGDLAAETVLVVEGEFKAIISHKAAMVEGLSVLIIALPGVDNWVGTQHKLPVHPHFQQLVTGKKVIICFDYDGTDVEHPPFTGMPKPQVLLAERKLLATVQALGGEPRYARIGIFNKDGDIRDKFAIDDYLLAGGTLAPVLQRTTKYDIDRVVSEKDPSKKDECSFAEAESYALASYGLYQGDIVRLSDGASLAKNKALDQWGAQLSRTVQDKRANPLAVFMHAKRCAKIESWVYAPASSFGLLPGGRFNLWKAWAPGRPGDVAPWTELVDFVLGNSDTSAQFFHDWVAFIVQNPGQKNFTYIGFVSPQNGVGKSLLAEAVSNMLRPCSIELSGERLFSKNNMLLEGKALVVVNELATDKAKHTNELKALITSPTIVLEEKYKAAREVPAAANFIITSNEVAPSVVSIDNRRDVIIRVPHKTKEQRDRIHDLACAFMDWFDQGGRDYMLYWYGQRDISSYKPRAAAPRFLGFETAVQASKTNAQMEFEAVEDFIGNCGLDTVALGLESLTVLVGGDRSIAHQCHRLLAKLPTVQKTSVMIKNEGTGKRYTIIGALWTGNNAELVRLTDEKLAIWVGVR